MWTQPPASWEPHLGTLPELVSAGCAAASPSLIPPSLAASLADLPDAIGASVVWALLECRLRPERARVDVAVLLNAGASRDELRRVLLGDPDRWPASWQDAGRAVVAWMFPGHPVHEARHLSLEWDCRPQPEPPFSFVTFEHAPGIPSTVERAARIAGGLAEAVDHRPLGPIDRAVLAALPSDGSALHFGCMGQRANGARRWVLGMPPQNAEPFLRDLSWGGDAALIGSWARRLAEGAPHISLHLDVGESLANSVGVEWFFPGAPRTDRRWAPLFAALEEHELATADSLAALNDWPGEAAGILRLLDLKVVFASDHPREAKAYLAYRPIASPKPGA